VLPIVVARVTDPRIVDAANGNAFFTTLEGENPSGSVKDRMVAGELDDLFRHQKIKAGTWIGEATFGSTGRSLAYYTRLRELKCVLFLPDFVASEDLQQLRDMGAEVHAVPLAQGMELYEAHCQTHDVFRFNQWTDPEKRRHYRPLGEAIRAEVGRVDVVIGSVGTGFSLVGAWEGLASEPVVMTAEPNTGEVFAVRNIERTPHGPGDPCTPESFAGRRVLLDEHEYFPSNSLQTSHGEIECPDSFRLTLGAALKVARQKPGGSFFVLGAANRRRANAGHRDGKTA
jgi:cysteine synthase